MICAGDELQGSKGSYRIEQVLHAAGQMLTARAMTAGGEAVVLKQLRIDALQSWKALELFERETAILQQLQHERLPRLIEAFQGEDAAGACLYLVCSWVEGESLLDRLNAGWKPGEEEVWELARQTLEILDYLHRFNPPVIHRDLKPGNLIMDDGGRIHLVDFGAVQGVLNPDGGSTVVGTFGYMPPEQFSDRCVPASDLYALGATLVHLLTGTYPSDLPRKGMKIDCADRLAAAPACRAWLDQLLDPIVEQRFASAREALSALEAARDQAQTRKVLALRKQPRLQTLARGTGLKILIRPPGLMRGLGLPACGGLTIFGWGLLCYWQVVEIYFSQGHYDGLRGIWVMGELGWPMVQALVLSQPHLFGLMGYGLWILLMRVIQLRTYTSLQLQPDRYLIEQRCWKFSRRFEGGSSELHRIERRFSLWRLAWTTRVFERSELSHIATQSLREPEALQLTGLIAGYLQGRNPQQAQDLVHHSLFPPKKNADRDLQELCDKLTGLGLRLRSRLDDLIAALPAPLARPGAQFLRLAGQHRIACRPTPDGLSLEIAPRWVSLRWLGVMTLWSGLSIRAFEHWLQSYSEQGIHGLLSYSPAEMLPLAWDVLVFAFGLGYLGHRLVASLIRSQLSLRGDSYRIRHRLWRFERSHTGRLSALQTMALQRRPWRRGNDLIFAQGSEGPVTVAHWLSRQEQHDLQQAISAHITSEGLSLGIFPRAVLREWDARCARWQQLAFGGQSRLQRESGPAGPVLRIAPRAFTGSLLSQQALGSFLLLTGLGLTGLGFYLLQACLGAFTQVSPFHGLLFQGLGTASDFAWFLSGSASGLSLDALGLGLLLRAWFLARVETTLSLQAGRIEVQHRLLRWRWQHSLDAGRDLRFRSVTPLARRLRLQASGQNARTLAYGLDRAEAEALAAEIRASLALPASQSEAVPASQAEATQLPAHRHLWQRFRARYRQGPKHQTFNPELPGPEA